MLSFTKDVKLMLKKLKDHFFKQQKSQFSSSDYFLYNNNSCQWSMRSYQKFADEAYVKNVIANRCIKMIATSAASVSWHLHAKNKQKELKEHPILWLLHKPNPLNGGAEFFENIYSYKMLSGNAYILALGNAQPLELHLLRPDRVTVEPSDTTTPKGYYYDVGMEEKIFYPIDKINAKSRILHLRNFHPLDDSYGLSTIESAAYSIDQHNQAAIWNQSLLQNGARPSGALMIKGDSDGVGSNLNEFQYQRLKNQVDETFSGAANSGRPLLLEGGLEWKEMSLTPKDMDFIEAKNSAARDIALAFGVPPQLLGIPGDNTYSNMQEARIALWEETILPMLDHVIDALNNWLVPMYGDNLHLSIDKDQISALSSKRELLWSRLEQASFMSVNEKRRAVGLSPIAGGDVLVE